MKTIRVIFALAMGLGLSACAAIDTPTRNAPLESLAEFSAAEAQQVQGLALTGFTVKVPVSLRVSEANLFYPVADIVWRGDPRGNRHEQVGAIFADSLQGAQDMRRGTRPVTAEVEVKRFHSLTEKTRYSVGGVHSIRFELTLRDAATGELLVAPRNIRADLKGYGGETALRAEAQGLTQKLRITRHLANVIAAELRQVGSAPTGVTQLVAGLETAAPI